MAYNYANCTRWSAQPFVLGIRIRLSGNHPAADICDELQGDYPRDFMWRGWHPRCRCSQSPIMMDRDSEEWKKLRSLPKEEYEAYRSPNLITDTPDKFNKWLDRNKENLAKARKRGKLPYFVRDNQERVGEYLGWKEDAQPAVQPSRREQTLEAARARHAARTPEKAAQLREYWERKVADRRRAEILAKAAERHASRTPEEIADIQRRAAERQKKHALMRKTATNVLHVAEDYPELDLSALRKAVKAGELDTMYALAKETAKKLAAVKQDEKALSVLIPNVHEWKKQFTSAELHQVFDAVENKMASIAAKPLNTYKYSSILEQQKALIESEIKYVADPAYLKSHSIYPTWKVAQDAFAKQLGIVKYKIEVVTIGNNIQPIKGYVANNKGAKKLAELLANVENSINANDELSIISANYNQLEKEWNSLQKANATRLAKKGAGDKHVVFTDDCFSETRKKNARKFDNVTDADNYYFQDAADAYSRASRTFKEAAEDYTFNSSSITRLLRGLDGWLEYENSYVVRNKPFIEAMTDTIADTRLRDDCWITRDERVDFFTLKTGGLDVNVLNRNIDSYADKLQNKYKSKYGKITSALKKEIDEKIAAYKEHEERQLIGRIGTDPSFCSTSSHMNATFSGTGGDNMYGKPKVHLEIFCPKGTQALYAAPFNHYNRKVCGTHGFWDGMTKSKGIREAEIFLQRGSKFRVIEAKYNEVNDKWLVKVEVIEQNAKDIIDYEEVYDNKACRYGYKPKFK